MTKPKGDPSDLNYVPYQAEDYTGVTKDPKANHVLMVKNLTKQGQNILKEVAEKAGFMYRGKPTVRRMLEAIAAGTHEIRIIKKQ